MPDTRVLEVLIQPVDPSGHETVSFGTLLQFLYDVRFTGAVTVHFRNGCAQVIEAPRPVQIRLEAAPPP